MKTPSRLIIATVLLCVAHLSAAAQTRNPWSVQGSLLYAGLGGSPYRTTNPGPGLELQGRWKINPLWSLGCGVQGTHHSTSPSGSETLEGLFCEPRQLVDINSETFFPYVSARAAVLRQTLTNGPAATSARGMTLNVGAGTLMPFGNAAGRYPTLVEIGASGGYTRFGDFRKVENNVTIEKGSLGGGWNFVLRAGLVVGLPFGTTSNPN